MGKRSQSSELIAKIQYKKMLCTMQFGWWFNVILIECKIVLCFLLPNQPISILKLKEIFREKTMNLQQPIFLATRIIMSQYWKDYTMLIVISHHFYQSDSFILENKFIVPRKLFRCSSFKGAYHFKVSEGYKTYNITS